MNLLGRLSNPLPGTLLHPERWRSFEVVHGGREVYVTTRTADEFTDAVADGFARFVERWWQGEWVKQ